MTGDEHGSERSGSTRSRSWRGGTALALRTAGSFARIASDSISERFGRALPRTRTQIARPEVLNGLIREHVPRGERPLPQIERVSLPGIDFESSNCTNFLLEVEFGAAAERDAQEPLPRTLYVKLPCDALATRSFANTLGFWPLECTFCERVAQHVPIRVPRVYAATTRGARFVLLLENLHEIPGARLFLNRDMAAGTTPERAHRVLHSFARMHAHFWGWSETEREAILPAQYNTFTSPRWRDITHAMNAAALAPAARAAPALVSESVADTYRLAMQRWDRLLRAWYRGPLTLIHGDSHLGNCFEYPALPGGHLDSEDRGSQSEDALRVGLLDFQAVHWSKGMRDVQYFMINSLESDVLEANEQALIQSYCSALADHGVSLSYDEAWEQYRAFSFQTLLVGVVPLGLGSLTERSETVLTVTRRAAAAVERLDFRRWLEALPA